MLHVAEGSEELGFCQGCPLGRAGISSGQAAFPLQPSGHLEVLFWWPRLLKGLGICLPLQRQRALALNVKCQCKQSPQQSLQTTCQGPRLQEGYGGLFLLEAEQKAVYDKMLSALKYYF